MIINRIYYFILIGMVVPCLGALKKTSPHERNILHKINHHQGGEHTLEVANVMLYFEHEPIINTLRHVAYAHNKEEQVFFFPWAQPSAEMIKQIVKHMKDESKDTYDIYLKEVTKPTKGIVLIVQYDPMRIGIGYDFFDSIGLQKGVIFRIYNKTLLHAIREKGKGILRTAHHKPKVVIDCGHGGSDIGTIAHNQLQEKDLCLHIGLQVAQQLEHYHIPVLLTRNTDDTVTLDERTTLANKHNADVFISIHANAAENKYAQGIETFCIDGQFFKKKFCTLNTTDYEIYSLISSDRYTHGLTLAQQVHNHVLQALQVSGYSVVDRKIKRAVSQVLGGAGMPAMLIEVGFLSHKQEAQLLQQPAYQAKIADGITQGIIAYLAKS